MRSLAPGKRTSKAEVLGITPTGLWLSVQGREYFLPHREFPWFAKARVSDVYHVKLVHGSHLHWPDLDVDLHVESLAHPERFPLKARGRRG